MDKNYREYDPQFEEDIDFNISEWINFFWSNRFVFLKVIVASLFLGIIFALHIPKQYTAVATILPPQVAESKVSSMLSGLGGLAGDMIGGGDVMTKVYPEIAKSRNVLLNALNADYKGSKFRDAFQQHFKFKKNVDDELLNAIQKGVLTSSVAMKTNVFTVSVTYRDPELASAFTNEILSQMETFLNYQFRSVASSQRSMIEQRMSEVSDSLKIVEDRLLQFRESNRTTGLSPKLQLSEGRFLREVEINNALYVELARQLEIAKISELQLKPVINILDKAVPPIRKSKPSRKAIVLVFGFIGFISTILYLKIKPKIRKNK